MTLQTEISEAIRAMIRTELNARYNIAFGFFQGYSSTDNDTSGLRYCDIKLHYKTSDSQDINILEVPILYPGSKNSIDDFTLVKDDELFVLFSDRSLEQWNAVRATQPQKVLNPVRDSINQAFCIPINSHHNNFTSAPDSTVAKRITVESGKKMQFGNGVDEFLKIQYDFMSIINSLSTTDGDALAADLATKKTQINALVTQMTNITKI